MSEEKEFHSTVSGKLIGQRLDKALHELIPDFSRTYLKELIEKGFVTVNQRVITKPGKILVADEAIQVQLVPRRQAAASEASRQPLKIIFQDSDLAVIDKPSAMSSHPNTSSEHDTVADAALAMFGNALPRGQGEDRPGIVHRLDRDTTGVMLLAKTQEAFLSLRKQFKDRSIEKEYRAIVRGKLRFDSDHIEGLMGRDPKNPEKMAILRADGKESSTYYETLERFADFSYVRCCPETGRTHQIRVHLSHLGHPIVGDRLYRVSGAQWNAPKKELPPVHRQFLHAFSISFLHPKSGDRISFEAPLHKDMNDFLNFLRRENRD